MSALPRKGCRRCALPPHSTGLLVGAQVRPDEFFVVTGVDVAVGKGWMRPDDVATGRGIRRFKEMSAADLGVAFGGELGDDQIAFFVFDEVAVSVFHQVAPPGALFSEVY